MRMQITALDLHIRALQRGLVYPHTIREMCLEEVVVAFCDIAENFREVRFFEGGKVGERAAVLAGDDEGFEGPSGPPGAEGYERRVLAYDAFLKIGFEGRVVCEHVAAALFAVVFPELLELKGGFFGEGGGGPDLAVGVGVRATHCGPFVLEDLHVAVLCFGLGCVSGVAGWWDGC